MLRNHVPLTAPIEPAELALLQHAFDEICKRRGIAKNTERAEQIAADVISFYRHGIRDGRQLIAMLSGGDFP